MKLLKFFIFLILAALFLFSILVSFSLVVFKNISSDLPDISRLRYFQPPRATQLYSYDGKLIGTIFKENRTWISLNQVPLILKEAFFAIEDSRFYKHHGFDVKGILRAVIADLKGEAVTQGASTITQQLARNLFLSPQVSIKRKIQEIFLAIQIEKKYTKDEILELYLNQIYFGAGAYGIQAASSIYFDKGVKSLTLPEAAVLSGLPAAPSLYSPLVNFNLAKERQKLVLERMKLLGYINEEESLKAYKTDLKISNKQYEFHSLSYPYFTTYVLQYLFNKYKSDLIFRGGLKVYTTLNPKMQEIAQNILRKGVNRGLKEGLNCHEGALVALDPRNGYIRAMAGGLKFETDNQFNRAWQARRQPGSAFKVFVYTTAMDSGLYTPKSIISDSPISYHFSDGQVWAPVNNDGKYWGAIPLMKALQFSRNVVAVKLMEKLTP
ncbi:MAG: transglycosylase domain-containing protein, partial [Armatimonadetes bacterium]|nr:transglycosylase domain-containing protein [Armatimonadota bacterium]